MPQRVESVEQKQRVLFARAEVLRDAADNDGSVPGHLALDLGRALRRIAFGELPEDVLDVMPRGARTGNSGAVRSSPFARDLRAGALPGWGGFPAAIANDEQLPLIERQRRLYSFGEELENAAASAACRVRPELLRFLAWALAWIAAGDDGRKVLGVRAKRGEHYTALASAARERLMVGWIAAAIDPEGPNPIELREAISRAAEHFQVKVGTARRCWNESTTHRGQVFTVTGESAGP